MQPFRLGVIINPLAGLGGAVALKGSDGVAAEALRRGAVAQAATRMQQALAVIQSWAPQLQILTASAAMGQTLTQAMGFQVQCCYQAAAQTSAADTQRAAAAILQQKPDLLLFAGGDGTARDILAAVGDSLPVLGVPAGVKIHSGVYGITPHAAGRVVEQLLQGQLVTLMRADVMDIDEVAFRQGSVKARRFGEMSVPAAPRYIQAVKMGGREVDELVLADIAAEVIERMEDELYVMGSGSTVAAIMAELGLANTLLGVDVIENKQLVAADVTAEQLLALTAGRATKLVITLIGGQGHLLGRGNQQLSAAFIRQIGRDNILIVASKTKLKALAGRPLLVDSGDPQLDAELSGYYPVITGYRDCVMYRVANPDLVE